MGSRVSRLPGESLSRERFSRIDNYCAGAVPEPVPGLVPEPPPPGVVPLAPDVVPGPEPPLPAGPGTAVVGVALVPVVPEAPMLLLLLAALRFCVVSVVEVLVVRAVDWQPASTASDRLSKMTGRVVILKGIGKILVSKREGAHLLRGNWRAREAFSNVTQRAAAPGPAASGSPRSSR
jgi:hypothetical protein